MTPPVAHIFTPRKYECLDSGTDSTRSRVDRNTWRKRSKDRERERTVTWYFNCSGTSLWKISSKTPLWKKKESKNSSSVLYLFNWDANGSKQGVFHLCLTQIRGAQLCLGKHAQFLWIIRMVPRSQSQVLPHWGQTIADFLCLCAGMLRSCAAADESPLLPGNMSEFYSLFRIAPLSTNEPQNIKNTGFTIAVT